MRASSVVVLYSHHYFMHIQALRNSMFARHSFVCGFAVIHCGNYFELIYDTLHGDKLMANTSL